MILRTEVSDGDAVITLWGRGRRARATVRRGALKTLLLLAEVSDGEAVITLWGRGRRARATVRGGALIVLGRLRLRQ